VKPTLLATYGAGLLQEIPKGKGRKKFRMKERVRRTDTNEIKINEIGQVDWQ
jgi:hypothetical protein